MLGWLRWSGGRKAVVKEERLLGLPVLTLYLPERQRGHERKLRKAFDLLPRRRVSRLLVPPEFEYWPLAVQSGLRSVNTQGLCCALAPAWVEAVLCERGLRPEQAVLCLSGERENRDMLWVARALCPIVRNLVIDVPGGEELSAALRREFGLPVLPPRSARPDLTLRFASGPVLEGVSYGLRNVSLPADCEVLPLLSALWESGQVKMEEIVLRV